MAEFLRAVEMVIDVEGWYVNDSDDPGGPTKYGISQKDEPGVDIKSLTRAQARAIYMRDYWAPMGCASLPQGIGAALFDAGVNLGPATAIKILQGVLGVTVDGINGPITSRACNEFGDQEKLVAIFTLRRIEKYASLANSRKSRRKFFRGWINRTLRVYNEGAGR